MEKKSLFNFVLASKILHDYINSFVYIIYLYKDTLSFRFQFCMTYICNQIINRSTYFIIIFFSKLKNIKHQVKYNFSYQPHTRGQFTHKQVKWFLFYQNKVRLKNLIDYKYNKN